MSSALGSLGALVVALAWTLAVAPARAQDDAPEASPPPSPPPVAPPQEIPPEAPPPAKDRLWLYAELGMWVAQGAGHEYEPATSFDPAAPLDTTPIGTSHGTEPELRYRVGVELPGGAGGFLLTWYAHEDEQTLERSTPGHFGFGQALSFPLLSGVNNDGLADAFSAFTDTQLRDLRIDYWHSAFTSERVSARWFVGYRDVTHRREMDATYYALEPLLPPLIPPLVTMPRPDLEPFPEFAVITSEFKGRGVEGGLDVRVPLFGGGRVTLEGGFALASLRGDVDSDYLSLNAFYAIIGAPGGRPDEILSPPYAEFEEIIPPSIPGDDPTPLVNFIVQGQLPVGLTSVRRSTSADVLEAYLGARGKIGKGFELFAGFQSTHYDGVGVDLRPTLGSFTGFGVVEAVSEVDRSVTYEGFYFGGSVRF